ncbi:glucoamylase family protein [Zavarzinella formosa]|uniref:glucoamylase family protein n=1 Tax=Zavarzinella formosa TaxID=360055 RepID=UPI000304103F|nr:glucoamylase family protein [Zavarzinella formosa]
MSNVRGLNAVDRMFLMTIQQQSLRYFLENQSPDGLILDRQANFGPLRPLTQGWCSTAATGMGLIALALASREPYHLISQCEAVGRIRLALHASLEKLPEDHGMMPHFYETDTNTPQGRDTFSTVDSAWLIGGALWAAGFLKDGKLERLASQLYERVDWLHWTGGRESGLLNHGKNLNGKFLRNAWDRLNGETILMYVLGAGAKEDRALPQSCWKALKPFYGEVAGLRFNNADLGLFAFGYGLDLLDMARWLPPGGVDLAAEARIAVKANYLFCREKAARFATYSYFWGVSDGDGPGDRNGKRPYRRYAPGRSADGTAHLNATVAAIANAPEEVLENLARADRHSGQALRGRYGYANLNLDREWVGGDAVGIDAGAIVMALDNYLMDDRVRQTFHSLPSVALGMSRVGFTSQ